MINDKEEEIGGELPPNDDERSNDTSSDIGGELPPDDDE